jgi:hypothetical protein
MTITHSFQVDGYRAGTRHPAHRHDALRLSLVLSGRVAETVGSATEYASALSVVGHGRPAAYTKLREATRSYAVLFAGAGPTNRDLA